MKILTKKKQSEMLQRLAANHIIAANAINRLGLGETTEMSIEEYADAMEHLIDNTCRLSEMVGGIRAMVTVKEMVDSKSHLVYKIGNEIQ
jgi:hypothetical protein